MKIQDLNNRFNSNHTLYSIWYDEFVIPNEYVSGMSGLVEYGNDVCLDWMIRDLKGKSVTQGEE